MKIDKKIIGIIAGAALAVVILVLILSLTMCGKTEPTLLTSGGSSAENSLSSGQSSEDSGSSEDNSSEDSSWTTWNNNQGGGSVAVKNNTSSSSAESKEQPPAPPKPKEDPNANAGWYDTGLKCPLTKVEWENFTDENGNKKIRVGDDVYPAPESFYFADGSVGFVVYHTVPEPNENPVYTIKVYKNGKEVKPGEYVDENMVYRVFDGRDGSVTDHRMCVSMSMGGEGTNFSHAMWTAERKFTVAPNTKISDPKKYFSFYNLFGLSVKIFDGSKEATGGVLKAGMFVRMSKNGGTEYWDYKVIIDPNFTTYVY